MLIMKKSENIKWVKKDDKDIKRDKDGESNRKNLRKMSQDSKLAACDLEIYWENGK